MREVFVLGVGMHPFGRFPDTPLRALAGAAARAALRDAGVGPREVQAAYFANALGGLLTGQESIRGQIALREAGVAGVPVVNVENACASGATAFHQAVLAVGAGACDIALAVGAEKMFVGDTGQTLRALAASADVELTHDMGLQFTAIYAMRIQARLASGSLALRHLAEVTVKSHRHGRLNPYAQHRKEVTAEEVLASRPIAGPIRLLMSSSERRGGGGGRVQRRGRAPPGERHRHPGARLPAPLRRTRRGPRGPALDGGAHRQCRLGAGGTGARGHRHGRMPRRHLAGGAAVL